MTPELRRQIFELAALGRPRTQIARDLGISEGSVRYQLDKPATKGTPAGAGAVGAAPGVAPAPPNADPADAAVVEARRRLQLEQIQTSELDLRAQRLQAERRLALLEKAPNDGSAGVMMLVIEELKEIRRDLAKPAAQAPTAPPPVPIYAQLAQMREGLEAARSIAGEGKTPSTEAELAARVALDRLSLEGEERRRKLDFELEDLRAHRENERIRAEAVAEQIRQWGPLLLQGAQTWFAQKAPNGAGGEGAPGGVAGSAPTRPASGALVALPGGQAVQPVALGMVEGPCPNCGAPLRIRPSPGDAEICPRCAMPLAVVEGKIWPKLAAPGANGNALPSIAG